MIGTDLRALGQKPLLGLFIAVAAMISACALLKSTPRQEAVWNAVRTCEAKYPGVSVRRVEPNGRYWYDCAVSWQDKPFRQCVAAELAAMRVRSGWDEDPRKRGPEPVPILWFPDSPLPNVRRAGLPPRSEQEDLLMRQLTSVEYNGLRAKAVKLQKDIVLTGGLTETNNGLARRYVVSATPLGDTDRSAIDKEGRLDPRGIGLNREVVAAKLGVPDWRAAKPMSGLIDNGIGDVDIWAGSNLTDEELAEVQRDVFPKFSVDSKGYSKERYRNIEDLPGALVFRANGTVERILAPYQK